ncbi:MAG: NAD(P)H-binding protein [Armatimonadetes bacterium]|nr:NAD(P)H-binding protein [Armatimonadota bacterium]
MSVSDSDVVTGAFGYSGQYITRRLLAMGRSVRTLTGRPDRPNPFGERVEAFPFHFDRPDKLAESLRGADTLYNTYWVRFTHGRASFDRAVENTKILIDAAREAGVRRIVHISITNPDRNSSLPYFSGKAALEDAVRQSGLSYAILRPTVIFGPEDILINNIAYFLRKFPLFAVPGSGGYRLQPVFVEDMAGLAAHAGQSDSNLVLDAVGPEIFTFDELVRLIAAKIGSRARIAHLPPAMALGAARLLGSLVGDVVLTREEVKGLMAGLLVSPDPPTCHTLLSDWLAENAACLGARYASELGRHFR